MAQRVFFNGLNLNGNLFVFRSVGSGGWIYSTIKRLQYAVSTKCEQPGCYEGHKPHPEGLAAKRFEQLRNAPYQQINNTASRVTRSCEKSKSVFS